MSRLMSVLFAAVLLCLPSVSLAQGNAFGGGGGSVDLTNVTTDINLTTPGASITIAPHTTAGSSLVLDEGSNAGTHKFTLKVPDFSEGGLADDVMCKIDSSGVLNSDCPFYPWAGGTAADILWAQVVAGTLPADPSSPAGASGKEQWLGVKTIYHTGANINPSSFANPTCGSNTADGDTTNCYNAITLSPGNYDVLLSSYSGSVQTAAATVRCRVSLRNSVSGPNSGSAPLTALAANDVPWAAHSGGVNSASVNSNNTTVPAYASGEVTVTAPSGSLNGNKTWGVRVGSGQRGIRIIILTSSL